MTLTADFAGPVHTNIQVQRWDADQVAWAQARFGSDKQPGWEPTAREFAWLGVRPYYVTEDFDCNMVLLGGWAVLLGGIAGTSITNKLSATFGRIGIGTSNAAVVATQTFLQGDTGGASTTSYYQLVSGAPAINTAVAPATLIISASFPGNQANFSWQEFGTDNWNASGVTAQSLGVNEVFINRGLSNQGTKINGQVWAVTETISFGNPSGAGTVS